MSYSSFPTGGFYPAQNTGEPFLVFSTPSGLTNYSLLSASTGISLTLGAGTAEVKMDINGLTELTTVDTANDFIPIYDASATSIKKVKPSNLGLTTVLSDLFSELAYVSFTTVSGSNPTISDSINVSTVVRTTNTITVTFTSAFASTPFILSAFVHKSGGAYEVLTLTNIGSSTSTISFNIEGLDFGTGTFVTGVSTSSGTSVSGAFVAPTSGASPTNQLYYNTISANTGATITRSQLANSSGCKVTLLCVGAVVT